MKAEMAYQIKCDEIEESEGKAARIAYEKQVEADKIQKAEERSTNRKVLLYGLVDMGICPFVDVEGERQMYLFDNGIDLNKVPATTQQKEMMNLKRDKKLAARREKERFIVKCIVEDQKLQGVDPVQYLEENQMKTKEIVAMKDRQLDAVVGKYQELLSTQGSLSGIKADVPFDMAAAVAVTPSSGSSDGAGVDEVKAAKEAAKVKAKEEKAKAKAEVKAAKETAKAEAKALKERVAAEKLAAKEAAAAEKAAAKEAAAAEKAAAAAAAVAAEVNVEAETDGMDVAGEAELEESFEENTVAIAAPVAADTSVSTSSASSLMDTPVPKIIGVVGAGGIGIAFMQKSKAAREAEEEERQRQFKLIMGLNEDVEEEEEDDGGDDEPLAYTQDILEEKPKSSPASAAVEVPKKKKRRGLSSVFSKKNARETDIMNLVASDAEAPEFASLLAKLLTFGAKGRFPEISALPGGMPMDKFELEEAKKMLIESRVASSLTDDVSAEQFACVVNCMIIDIIDLASSSLGAKEKKDSVTVDALNVVMEFMDHAASLFDAVADGVSITPVTYGGTLSKSKLEEMYSIYSTAGLTSLDGGVTQDRIDTLQQVFNINDKRAEGLAQKAMMKNLMNMMKEGGEGGMEEMLKGLGGMEGMEGMEEMMAAMAGDGGGMPGFGDGEDISPEQLKASVKMMKDLIDSGQVSDEELKLVREQFKTMYGSDINELIKSAEQEGGSDELGEDGAELLQLFKEILKED